MNTQKQNIIDLGGFGVIDNSNLAMLDEATGIRYDFNYGAQIRTPATTAMWNVMVTNEDTGDVLYKFQMPGNSYWSSDIKYYIRYGITMTKVMAADPGAECTFKVVMDLNHITAEKPVALMFAHKTLGDCIAYFSRVRQFCQRHNCIAHVYVQQWFIDLYGPAVAGNPDYNFITFKTLDLYKNQDYYATYRIGLIFNDQVLSSRHWQKEPHQHHGLQDHAAYILGLNTDGPLPPPYQENPVQAKQDRPFKEKYVCISYSGSKQCKFWHNPVGWPHVIAYLKKQGYKVVCIDRYHHTGMPGSMMTHPAGCCDYIGDYPLSHRAWFLKHAEFFIGMASGLAWLAWACGTPAIVISGFSRPSAEFDNPYRVYNEEAECTDCWGDINIPFDRHDWGWCPRIDAQLAVYDEDLRKTDNTGERHLIHQQREAIASKKFICTQQITAERVIRMINKVIKDKANGNKS